MIISVHRLQPNKLIQNITHSKMIILSVTKNKGEGVKQHPLRNILPTFLGQGMKVGLKRKSWLLEKWLLLLKKNQEPLIQYII